MFKLAENIVSAINDTYKAVSAANIGKMSFPGQIAERASQLADAAKTGIAPKLDVGMAGIPNGFSDYMNRIAKRESGFNPQAVNKFSGASGLFQFMPRTAANYGIKDMNAFKANPVQQMQTMYKFTMDNANIANKRGFNINVADGIDEREGRVLAAMHYGGTGALNNMGNYNYMNRGQAFGHPSIRGYQDLVYRG